VIHLLAEIEADIKQRQQEQSQLEERLVAIRVEIDELQIAARVIRRKQSAADPQSPSNLIARPLYDGMYPSLEGKTIEESARIILTEHNNVPMHYRDLATEAGNRGYRSGRSDEVSEDSFQTMMDRKSSVFERVGGGKYRLKASQEAGGAFVPPAS
jgi:hypothetical protein